MLQFFRTVRYRTLIIPDMYYEIYLPQYTALVLGTFRYGTMCYDVRTVVRGDIDSWCVLFDVILMQSKLILTRRCQFNQCFNML